MNESKREIISPHGHKRQVRRDSKGRFAESGKPGNSRNRDEPRPAKPEASDSRIS